MANYNGGRRPYHQRKLIKKLNIMTDEKGRRVFVIPNNDSPPKLKGHRAYFSNRSGDIIHHPSAYSKKGWSSMEYCCSTLGIYVGQDWLKANLTESERLGLLLEDRSFLGKVFESTDEVQM